MLIIGFVTSILVLFGAGSGAVENMTAMITVFGSVVAYITTEVHVDAKYVELTDDPQKIVDKVGNI